MYSDLLTLHLGGNANGDEGGFYYVEQKGEIFLKTKNVEKARKFWNDFDVSTLEKKIVYEQLKLRL